MNTLTSQNWQTTQQANWQTNKANSQTSNSTDNLSRAFGKTFLEQVAMVVSGNEASNRQKMQDKKNEYSSKKKLKDLEDERVALLGRVRVLGQKFREE